MQTFVISSKNIEKGRDEAVKLAKAEKVGDFDLNVQEFEKALGIPDVRNIQKNLYLAPFKSEKKALVLVIPGGATTEAQNAMLKFLEEPPPSALIFIVVSNHFSLLPTILSRVKIIELENDQTSIEANLQEILGIKSASDALLLAQNLSKDKAQAITWLEQTILAAREQMIEKAENKQEALRLRKLIHHIEVAHYDLKNTNVNARLALENLFLGL